MIFQDELDRLLNMRIADLRWESWQYSFARTLWLSGHDIDGKKIWLLLQLTNFIDLPMELTNPSFSLAAEKEVQAIRSQVPLYSEGGRDSREFFKITSAEGSYFLWINKLTVIDEADNPEIEQIVAGETERLERDSFPV